MLFQSVQFLAFFPAVAILYFTVPHRLRWILLLASSYFFYMTWNAKYALLLLLVTLISYYAGLKIGTSDNPSLKKIYLRASLLLALGILFLFKYLNFLNGSINALAGRLGLSLNAPYLNIILPIGISFYTFQSLSYVIDVYRGKIPYEKHFGIFASYISFFPQLIAGPIQRAGSMIPQFFQKHGIDFQRISNGLKIILWGFFLKLVLADGIAILVNRVYDNVYSYSGLPLLAATFLYSFQIYGDFAGYTYIAVGTAKILGFDLAENFRRPYHSKSIAEFWKRWHITLSSWFQDYVFTPFYLYLSRIKHFRGIPADKRHKLSFSIAMIIGLALLGLWHGANWTFVLFGLYHGILVVLYHLNKSWWDKINKYTRIAVTFALASFGWVFFRANSVSESFYIFTHMFKWTGISIPSIAGDLGISGLFIIISSILFVEAVYLIQEKESIIRLVSRKPILARWTIYYIMIFAIILLGSFGSVNFIYSKF